MSLDDAPRADFAVGRLTAVSIDSEPGDLITYAVAVEGHGWHLDMHGVPSARYYPPVGDYVRLGFRGQRIVILGADDE